MKLYGAATLARELLREHGLAQKGWRFAFDRSRRRFGFCQYRPRLITLSAALTSLNPEAEVRNTLLHEIAHALIGPGVHHGPRWVRQARAIGCDGARCYSDTVVAPPAPWTGTCPACGRTVARHRRVFRLACGRCCRVHNGGRHSADYVFQWRRTA